MRDTIYTLLVSCFLVLWATTLLGQTTQIQEDYQVHITKTSETINIDGQLTEDIWQKAEVATDFWMSFPIDNERVDPAVQTEVMVAHDDKFIYVAAKLYGHRPYVMPSLKRDTRSFWSGDVFSVVFDPINEKTNAFNFATNTAGVQTEAIISGNTGTRGSGGSGGGGINSAWDNKWYSEATIHEDYWICELAIPFKSLRFSNKEVWGINFLRGDSKTNAFHTWAPVPVQFVGVDLGYTGALIWDEAPKASKSNISIIPYALTSTFKDIENASPADNNIQIGGDAKIAVTPGLNLDLTINPDFSQVDVDEQVTNLTTVNLRFPERRLFFLENSDLFSEIGIPPMRPFFSRRIGLDEDGQAIPIAYGARLSGNLNKDLRIGIMNLQTKSTAEFLGQNYTSIAANQQVFGRSRVKAYFHNRQAFDGGFQGDDYNRVGGFELEYRTVDGRWRGNVGYGKSWSNGLKDDNYFYNVIATFSNRNFRFYTNVAGVGNNYRADIGFIPRINHYDAVRDTTLKLGFVHGFTTASYTIFPKDNSSINSHNFSARNVFDYTKDGWNLIQNRVTLGYTLNWANASNFQISGTHEEQGLLFPFAFTSEEPLPSARYGFSYLEVNYNSDRRKAFGYNVGFRNGGFFNGTRSEYSLGANYRAQPWGNFSMNFVFNDLEFPEPYGSTKLFLIGPKLEFNFSRALFWTTFLQYNTQRDNFNINSRIQWRFKPLSDLFLVYSDNYATDIWGPKNRGVVLKLNYWINL